jgi:hypothetical protein
MDIASKMSLLNSSSGRSSVSLNSLLSDYLTEMQQLADGTLFRSTPEDVNPPQVIHASRLT